MSDQAKHMAAVHLYNWQNYGGDNFHSLLFMLISKADKTNYEKLRVGFPFEVAAYEEWQSCKTQVQFFRRYGL